MKAEIARVLAKRASSVVYIFLATVHAYLSCKYTYRPNRLDLPRFKDPSIWLGVFSCRTIFLHNTLPFLVLLQSVAYIEIEAMRVFDCPHPVECRDT